MKLLSALSIAICLFQIDGTTRKSYTYHDVISRSERLAAGLQRFGVKPGDVIAMVTSNNIDFLGTFYASTLINAVFLSVNPLFTQGKYEGHLESS